MTDNTRMVDLPWHDGTTRTVPEGTAYETLTRRALYAHKDGYKLQRDSCYSSSYDAYSAAVRIFTEAPEPPVKVNVPTGIGAIVSQSAFKRWPAYVLGREGWLGLGSGRPYEASLIADEIRNGARVLFEGVAE